MQRRTAAAGHCELTLITRTRDPFERTHSGRIAFARTLPAAAATGTKRNPAAISRADRIKTRIITYLRCTLHPLATRHSGGKTASHENRIRQTRFQLIEQSWHVEKTCGIGTSSRTWKKLFRRHLSGVSRCRATSIPPGRATATARTLKRLPAWAGKPRQAASSPCVDAPR